MYEYFLRLVNHFDILDACIRKLIRKIDFRVPACPEDFHYGLTVRPGGVDEHWLCSRQEIVTYQKLMTEHGVDCNPDIS
jgi:hypothetical protein